MSKQTVLMTTFHMNRFNMNDVGTILLQLEKFLYWAHKDCFLLAWGSSWN